MQCQRVCNNCYCETSRSVTPLLLNSVWKPSSHTGMHQNRIPAHSTTLTNSPPLPVVTKHICLQSCVTKGTKLLGTVAMEVRGDCWKNWNLPSQVSLVSHDREVFEDKFGSFRQKCEDFLLVAWARKAQDARQKIFYMQSSGGKSRSFSICGAIRAERCPLR